MRKIYLWLIMIFCVSTFYGPQLRGEVVNNVTGLPGFKFFNFGKYSDFSTIAGRDYFELGNISYNLFGTGIKRNAIYFTGYINDAYNYALLFDNLSYTENSLDEEERLSVGENRWSAVIAWRSGKYPLKIGLRPWLFTNSLNLDGQSYGRGYAFGIDAAISVRYRNLKLSLMRQGILQTRVKYSDGYEGRLSQRNIVVALSQWFGNLEQTLFIGEATSYVLKYRLRFLEGYLGIRREKGASVYSFNGGIGLSIQNFRINYALDYSPAGPTHFWGVRYRFWYRSRVIAAQKKRYDLYAYSMNAYPLRGMGDVILENKSDSTLLASVRYKIKGFSDIQQENVILRPHLKKKVRLKPRLYPQVLKLTHRKRAKLKLQITYTAENSFIYKTSMPVVVSPIDYGDSQMLDEMAAYIVFKDPRIVDLVSDIIKKHNQIRNKIFVENKLQNAMLFYYLLRDFQLQPLNYNTIQLPLVTLERGRGDVRDLCLLYATLLEASGIRTFILKSGDKFFVLFNTGIPADEIGSLGFLGESAFVIDGYVYFSIWLFAESLQLPFISNVKMAYSKISESEDVVSIDVEDSFKYFPPVSTRAIKYEVKSPSYENLKRLFLAESPTLEREALNYYVTLYKQLIKKEPRNPEWYNQLGLVYAKNLKFDTAIEYFEKALSLDSSYYPAYNNLGNVYTEMREYTAAEYNYGQSIKLQPKDARFYVNMGLMFEKKGDLYKAQEYYIRAAELDPTRFGFLKRRITLQKKNKKN